jgi:hypothetical protein
LVVNLVIDFFVHSSPSAVAKNKKQSFTILVVTLYVGIRMQDDVCDSERLRIKQVKLSLSLSPERGGGALFSRKTSETFY